MREFVVYSRRGCHLCELMLETLEPLCRGRATIVLRDVDSREDWRREFGELVPVLCADGREICRYELDLAAVKGLLAEPTA